MTTTPSPLPVMLVDDHPVVRAGLSALLEADGTLRVAAQASDGREALTLLEGGARVSAVVMDLQMPGMGGVEAIGRIRAMSGPPVLVLTTFDTQADVMAALGAGAVSYLLKDAPADQLRAAVHETAAGRAVLAPSVTTQLVARASRPAEALSERETEILRQLATGATNRQLARALVISEATVKTHLVHIYAKLGVDNRTSAVHAARERKLI